MAANIPDQFSENKTARCTNTTLQPGLLFVDDNALVRETVRTLLQHEYQEILTADDAFTGLCLLAKHRPVNVLIDAEMQGLSGNHFCALAKSLLSFRSIRIIILLQQESDHARAKALAAGADAILVKPFGREELLNLLGKTGAKAA